ncbi:MAG: DNA-methyltransferase, partial [Planctomycetota bacterium]
MSEWQIVDGDCLASLAEIDHADCVITDPPYCSGAFTETARRQARGQGITRDVVRRRGWFAADNMGTAGLVWLLRNVAIHAARMLPTGASSAFFTDWRQVPNLAPAIESSGLRWSDLLVWDKGSAGLGTGFRAQHEIALVYTNGPGKFHSAESGNVIRALRVPSPERLHQAEKPQDLLRTMVRVMCPPGGLIVDPFCGSGSVGVAALAEGRHYL